MVSAVVVTSVVIPSPPSKGPIDERSDASASDRARLARTCPFDRGCPRCYVPRLSSRRSAIAAEDPGTPKRSRVPRWLPPLIWAGVVIGVSSLEDLQTHTSSLDIRDKLAHFGEYFVFGWLAARAFDGQGWSGRKHFGWTLAIGALLGIVDEFYQGFVPGRERSVYDLLADVLGVAAGWYFSREDQALGDDHRTPRHS